MPEISCRFQNAMKKSDMLKSDICLCTSRLKLGINCWRKNMVARHIAFYSIYGMSRLYILLCIFFLKISRLNFPSWKNKYPEMKKNKATAEKQILIMKKSEKIFTMGFCAANSLYMLILEWTITMATQSGKRRFLMLCDASLSILFLTCFDNCFLIFLQGKVYIYR